MNRLVAAATAAIVLPLSAACTARGQQDVRYGVKPIDPAFNACLITEEGSVIGANDSDPPYTDPVGCRLESIIAPQRQDVKDFYHRTFNKGDYDSPAPGQELSEDAFWNVVWYMHELGVPVKQEDGRMLTFFYSDGYQANDALCDAFGVDPRSCPGEPGYEPVEQTWEDLFSNETPSTETTIAVTPASPAVPIPERNGARVFRDLGQTAAISLRFEPQFN